MVKEATTKMVEEWHKKFLVRNIFLCYSLKMNGVVVGWRSWNLSMSWQELGMNFMVKYIFWNNSFIFGRKFFLRGFFLSAILDVKSLEKNSIQNKFSNKCEIFWLFGIAFTIV